MNHPFDVEGIVPCPWRILRAIRLALGRWLRRHPLLCGCVKANKYLFSPYLRFAPLPREYAIAMPIIRSQTHFACVPWLASFAYTMCSGLIMPQQKSGEIVRLLKHLRKRPPGRLVEIGTANGGTLLMLTRIARDDATIVSVSLPGEREAEEPAQRLFQSFALPTQELSLLRRDSHDLATRDEVVRLVGAQGLDFLFIDGDHSYAGVKQDFELYAPLVRPGGMVAINDIVRHHPEAECHVDDFWCELRRDHVCWEIVDGPSPSWAGIGVVRL